ncbi:MAG: hypothetical protein QM770_23015 [Tepidisphaeraceae bacterium]
MVVWGNRLNGVDVNGNALNDVDPTIPITHGVTVENVTAYNNGAGGNGYNFNFDESFAHVLKNNLSYAGGSGGVNSANIYAGVLNDHNTWNGIPVDANDFISLSDTLATGLRLPDGSLPISGFLRLRADSNLKDAGTNVGLVYVGAAPDVGAFEVGIPKPGDANLDGVVNFSDLLIVASNYTQSGKTWTTGDFDFNGTTNFTDLLLLAANYAAPGAELASDWSLAQALVPEPGALAAVAVPSVALRRRALNGRR